MEGLRGSHTAWRGRQCSLNEVGVTSSIFTQVRRSRETLPLTGRFDSTTNSTRSGCFLYHPNFVKTPWNCPFYSATIWGFLKNFLTLSHSLGKKDPQIKLTSTMVTGPKQISWRNQDKGNKKGASQTAPLILDLLLNFSLDPFLNFYNPGLGPFIVSAHGSVTRNS